MENILSKKDRLQLEAAYQVTRDKRSANKINILLLSDDGYEQNEVATILRLNQSTISRHIKAYKTFGLTEYLKNPFSGGSCNLTELQIDELENYIDNNLCGSTDEIILFAEKKFKVKYTRSGMSSLLKKLGFVFKKPILIPGKTDPEMQEAFIEYYTEIKASMKSSDKLYFLDGVHPQHNTVAAHGWVRKGKNIQLQSNTGRRRLNLNGALDTQTGEVIIREDKTIDATSTINLLKMLETNNKCASKIVVIVDNAPYYYNADVVGYIQESKKLEIVYLPIYSPNLNLIERLWRFMKKKVLYNKYYEKFSDFKTAIGDFFLRLPQYSDELDELFTDEFQQISVNFMQT